MIDAQGPPFTPPSVPPGWDKLRAAPPLALWAAVRPGDQGEEQHHDFRANLVLTCDDATGMTFRDWQVATDAILPRTLADYLLIDLERLEIDGSPGGRRLAHHVDTAGRALTMEQWFTLHDGRGWTLTATVETWSYDGLADACADVARTWRPVSGTSAAEDGDT